MSAARAIAPLLLVALAASAATAAAPEITRSPLALRSVRMAEPSRLASWTRDDEAPALLAQRAITREWGASDETTYVEVEVPGYRSEGWAMLLSAIAPGAGHLYVGEASGWLFALAEVGAWTARTIFDRRSETRYDELTRYTGTPYDPAGSWSFQRYALATSSPDTLALQQLYAGDPDAFFHLVGTDDRYLAGWRGTAADSRAIYQDFEGRFQDSLRQRRYATAGIVFTHVFAALDALRAARVHNEPHERNLRFRLKGALESGGEAMTLAIERKF